MLLTWEREKYNFSDQSFSGNCQSLKEFDVMHHAIGSSKVLQIPEMFSLEEIIAIFLLPNHIHLRDTDYFLKVANDCVYVKKPFILH